MTKTGVVTINGTITLLYFIHRQNTTKIKSLSKYRFEFYWTQPHVLCIVFIFVQLFIVIRTRNTLLEILNIDYVFDSFSITVK